MKYLKTIFVFLSSFIIAILFFELYLEYTVQKIDSHKKNKLPQNGFIDNVYYTWGHKVKNNSFGFRENEIVDKEKNVVRIMVIGDSLTWGAGVDERDRYSNQLSILLNKNSITRYKVLNFGVSGGDIAVATDTVQKYIKQVQPDIIIYGFCYNDTQPKSENYRIEYEKLSPYISYLTDNISAIGLHNFAQFMNQSIYKILENTNIIPPWQVGIDRTYDVQSEEWKNFRKYLIELRSIALMNGVKQIIMISLNQPYGLGEKTDYGNLDDFRLTYLLKWYNQAEDLANRLGYDTINVQQELVNNSQYLGVNQYDGHPNEKLHSMYANKLYNLINKNMERK